jgi:hypothetical protein
MCVNEIFWLSRCVELSQQLALHGVATFCYTFTIFGAINDNNNSRHRGQKYVLLKVIFGHPRSVRGRNERSSSSKVDPWHPWQDYPGGADSGAPPCLDLLSGTTRHQAPGRHPLLSSRILVGIAGLLRVWICCQGLPLGTRTSSTA